MKFVWQGGLLAVLLFTTFFFLGSQVPCKQPILYRLGTIDSRFGLSSSEVQKMLSEAEKPWENLAKRELFVFNQQEGVVTVNFVYDERQERTQEEQKLDQIETETNKAQESINSSYETKKAEYEKRSSAYESQVNGYQKRLARYNAQVESFNKNGQATESDVERLRQEASELENEAANLEKERLALNTLAQSLNALAGSEQKIINNYNDKVETFQERFQGEGLFDQGEFGGKELNIYQFKTRDDLRMVLVHELGHTLGLDHVENPQSVMYYLMEQQDITHITLSAEDRAAFESICAHPAGLTLGNLEEIIAFVRLRATQVMAMYE